jgi:hypothetical protein
MRHNRPMSRFGCERCYPEEAPTNWRNHVAGFEHASSFASESHLEISIWRCRHCSQPFVYVWMEFIDWDGGDDPQYHTLVPVERAELETIERRGDDVDIEFIGSLGRDRRRLDRDQPKGGPGWLGWRTGTFPIDWGH